MSQLTDTGERAMPGALTVTAIEHLHRYTIAQDVCRNKHVLDVASGEGYGTNLLAQVANSVIGVEIFSDAVTHAKANYKRDNLQFLQGDICKLPNESSTFDVVTCFETLEHVADHDAAISEIKRVMKADGVALISTPCRNKYNAISPHSNEFHLKELELSEFHELLLKYFKNAALFSQEMVYGSILNPLSSNSTEPKSYRGNFQSTKEHSVIDEAVYAVAIVSNTALPMLGASTFQPFEFDPHHEVDRLKHEVESLKNSTSFRLGQKIISPLFKLKSLVGK